MLTKKQINNLFDSVENEIKATMIRLKISEAEARVIVGAYLIQEQEKMRSSNG